MREFVTSVSDLQQTVQISSEEVKILEDTGVSVLREVLHKNLQRSSLPQAVEVSLIDDEAIGRVHADFMGDPTPTDVITFPYGDYGEILISLETAKRQGEEFGRPFFLETTLYLIHGILHLAGYTDQDPIERAEMEAIQEELLTQYSQGIE